MPDEMGSFRVDVEIENPARPGERRSLTSVLVDTGDRASHQAIGGRGPRTGSRGVLITNADESLRAIELRRRLNRRPRA